MLSRVIKGNQFGLVRIILEAKFDDSAPNLTFRQQPTNCLSVFDHFVGLALKGLKIALPIFN